MTELRGSTQPVRVGVVLPVHDEEHLVAAALDAVVAAMDQADRGELDCLLVVVLDRCSDGSAEVVEAWRRRVGLRPRRHIEVVTSDAGNVGVARHTGCSVVARHWPEADPASVWLSTTDADSRVPGDWIVAQLRTRRSGAEVWVGQVAVDDWTGRRPGTADEWFESYSQEVGPVHGANLGLDAATYVRLGGFPTVATGEDRALVDRAVLVGARVHHDSTVKVMTSARRDARAPGGFAHALTGFERLVSPTELPTGMAVS